MNAMDTGPQVLVLLDDAQFASIDRALDEQIAKQQNETEGTSTPTTLDATTQLLFEDMLSDQDWRTLHFMLTEAFSETGVATPRLKGMLALSKAHLRTTPNATILLAQEVYSEAPTEGTAYVAMAQARQSNWQSIEAQKWINLASKTSAVSTTWYKTTQKLIEQGVASQQLMQAKMLKVLIDETRWIFLKQHYNLEEENPALLKDLEELRSNPQDYHRLRETSKHLLSFTFTLFSDPCPAIFHEDASPPSVVEERGLASLPLPVTTLISTYILTSDHSRLRQASKTTNWIFGHPQVWQSVFQRFIADVSTIHGPITPHEWEFMCRSYAFVLESLTYVQPLSARVRPGGGHSDLLTDDDRQHLWSLARVYRIAQTVPQHSPLALIFSTAFDLHVLDGSKVGRIVRSFIDHGAIPIITASLLEQPYEHLTIEGALSLVTAWMLPIAHELSPLQRAGLVTGTRNLTLSAYRMQATMALNSLLLASQVEPRLRLVPLASSPVTVSSLRRAAAQLTLNQAELQKTLDSTMDVGFGLICKTDASGTYRIYHHYTHPELESERDEGLLQLRVDKETGRVSGRGIDTLRGPFLIFDARSREQIETAEKRRKEDISTHCLQQTLRLVVQYSDGLRVGLRGSICAYGYSGELEFIPDKKNEAGEVSLEEEDLEEDGIHLRGAEDPNATMGGWLMVYDHETSDAMATRWEDIWRQTEEKENEKIVTERDGQRFEPWLHQDKSTPFVRMTSIMRLLSSQLQTTTSHAADYTRALFLRHRRQPDPATVARIRPVIETLFPARVATESERKYKLRQDIFVILTSTLLEDRGRFALACHARRIPAAYNILGNPNHEQLASENAFWIEALSVSPFEPQYYYETLKSLYQDFIAPKEATIPVGQAQSIAIKTLRDSFAPKKRDPKLPSNRTSIILASIACAATITAAAFLSYRFFSKKSKKSVS